MMLATCAPSCPDDDTTNGAAPLPVQCPHPVVDPPGFEHGPVHRQDLLVRKAQVAVILLQLRCLHRRSPHVPLTSVQARPPRDSRRRSLIISMRLVANCMAASWGLMPRSLATVRTSSVRRPITL